jgi:thiol-disulfide isomerase/thioredoxin
VSGRRRLAAVLVAVATATAGLAGCSGAGVTPPPAETRVDVDTPQLRAAKRAADIADCPATPPAEEGSDLADVTLACLGGGEPVRLAQLSGPAMLPLWASWCEPCKEELPLFARLAEEAGDRLAVLGIDYQDTQPDLALELLRDSGARFPQVADPGGVLADHYRIRGLPGVLWVREDGSATFHNDRVSTYDELVTLVSSRLDVRVGGAG